MPKFLPLLGGGFTALLAFVYSAYIHTFLFEFAGLGTGTNELGTSHCRRIDSLAGCEDFVLHESESGDSRQIYLACADPAARLVWSTVASKLNMTGRGTTDFMAALDLDALGDKPWDDSTDPTDARNRAEKAVRKLEFDKGFRMFSGEGNSEFSAHGVAMWEMEDSDKVRLFVVDHRPPRKGKESEGADSVVHLFETRCVSSIPGLLSPWECAAQNKYPDCMFLALFFLWHRTPRRSQSRLSSPDPPVDLCAPAPGHAQQPGCSRSRQLHREQ